MEGYGHQMAWPFQDGARAHVGGGVCGFPFPTNIQLLHTQKLGFLLKV